MVALGLWGLILVLVLVFVLLVGVWGTVLLSRLGSVELAAILLSQPPRC